MPRIGEDGGAFRVTGRAKRGRRHMRAKFGFRIGRGEAKSGAARVAAPLAPKEDYFSMA
jgi:hypothetical protein